jgi:hypothetical protein
LFVQLSQKLSRRLSLDELIEKGIHHGYHSDRLHGRKADLEKKLKYQLLNAHLEMRPSRQDIQDVGYHYGDRTDDRLLLMRAQLERQILVDRVHHCYLSILCIHDMFYPIFIAKLPF